MCVSSDELSKPCDDADGGKAKAMQRSSPAVVERLWARVTRPRRVRCGLRPRRRRSTTGEITTAAFTGLRPADGVSHASWVLDALVAPPAGGVSFRVPPSFSATVRVHHELDDHASWSTVDPVGDVRTSAELPSQLPYPLQQVAGELDDAAVDALVPALRAATGTAEQIHFAQWLGWGEFQRASSMTTYVETDSERGASAWVTNRPSIEAEAVYEFVEQCPRVEWWGGRTMFLFDGPIEGLAAIGSPSRFSGPPALLVSTPHPSPHPDGGGDERSWTHHGRPTTRDLPRRLSARSADELRTCVEFPIDTARRVIGADRW